MPRHICVIGAGITGLSTALRIQESIKDVTVTIIAERVTPDTTSDGAGGFWEPHLLGDTPIEKLRGWGQITFEHLMDLSTSQIAGQIGVHPCSGIQLHSAGDVHDPFWKDIVSDFRYLTREELQKYPEHRSGWFYTTMVCEGRKYLPWLAESFLARGGNIIKRRISTFEELYDVYDIVVNCTGLGARDLCDDHNLTPAKGLVLKVEAPWITEFLLDDDKDLYILVNSNCIILGGTQENTYSLHVNKSEKQRIWDGCCKLIPSLKNSRHMTDWVGLRPTRNSIRLELETRRYKNTLKKIVHNYGHGGGGITLHWGCAKEAANLVEMAMSQLTTAKL